jgi:transcriptional regulator with GAF, ATPase, and Fis domain
VGSSGVVKVDIRVISATHRDLEKLVAEGHLRDDLSFRLKVFPINIPPLRERRADIPVLVQHVMRRKSREMGLHSIPMLAAGAIDVCSHTSGLAMSLSWRTPWNGPSSSPTANLSTSRRSCLQ